MSNSPGPSHPRSRYQALRELGRNPQAGRITYLAQDHATQQTVVIKQFNFAQVSPDWAGFPAYESQISRLKQLDHPGIPRYLGAFGTPNGLCVVREYKDAPSLAEPRHLEPEQIKQLAASILNILVYLQTQTPPVIHRNIKPENILVDEELNVYLIDFGLPYIKADGSALENTAGTVGFMPAEQLRNGELTETTDLYSLGTTFACFLTETPSSQLKTLFALDGHINFNAVVSPQISFPFIQWLEKLVEVYAMQRYANATAALESLKSIDIQRFPEVEFSTDSLEFKVAEWGQKLTQTLTVRNPVPDTLLKGYWEVAPHLQEPSRRRGYKAWISFEPQQFEGNRLQCLVTVDTSQLMADKIYKRQLIFQANTAEKQHFINIKVYTAKLEPNQLPKRSLAVLGVVGLVVGLLESTIVSDRSDIIAWIGMIIGTGTGFVGGVAGAFNSIPMVSSTVGTAVFLQGRFGFVASVGFILGFVVGATSGYVVRNNLGRSLPGTLSGFNAGLHSAGGQISFLIALFGIILGIALKVGFFDLVVILGLVLMGGPLGILIYRQYQILKDYRKSERNLIKP